MRYLGTRFFIALLWLGKDGFCCRFCYPPAPVSLSGKSVDISLDVGLEDAWVLVFVVGQDAVLICVLFAFPFW